MNNEWQILINAKNGDQKAAEQLYTKYSKLVFKMTVLITGSFDSANDIVQESFFKL